MADPLGMLMALWWTESPFFEIAKRERSDHVYDEFDAVEMVVEIVIDSDVRTYRETMELMALLACVDYDTWEQDMLAAHTKSSYSESQSFSPRFVLRLEWIDTVNEEEQIRFVQEVIQYIFSPLPFDQLSSAYRETRELLLSKTTSQEMRRKCENLQIPVVLSGLLWSHKLLVCFQRELEAVYTRQHAPRGNTSEDAPTCPFILTAMDMCLEEWAPWQANTAAIDSLLAQRRVPLRKLSCAEWEDTVRSVRAALGNVFG